VPRLKNCHVNLICFVSAIYECHFKHFYVRHELTGVSSKNRNQQNQVRWLLWYWNGKCYKIEHLHFTSTAMAWHTYHEFRGKDWFLWWIRWCVFCLTVRKLFIFIAGIISCHTINLLLATLVSLCTFINIIQSIAVHGLVIFPVLGETAKSLDDSTVTSAPAQIACSIKRSFVSWW